MENSFKKYYQAVKYIESLSRIPRPENVKGKTNQQKKLERFAFFMSLLGNPHLGQKYVHVAGSTGKGSIASMMQSVLVQAGYKTGLFLSPHTTAKIDRIRINNLFIDPDKFADLVAEMKPAIKTLTKSKFGRPTHFEVCLAIAFLYFKRRRCDYVVLEVGCGGKFDPTNIIPAPAIAIINLIDYDHEKLLGHTLTAIAKHKAGIIKNGSTLFTTASNDKKVLAIFEQACQQKHVAYHCISPAGKKYKLQLIGKHQQANANLVATACRYLKISDKNIKQGLAKTKIPCRMEIMRRQPLIIIDGAHNDSKFKSTLAILNNLTNRRLFIIIALTQHKQPKTLFRDIASQADFIFATKHKNNFHTCLPPTIIRKEILKYNPDKTINVFSEPRQALAKALSLAKKTDIILITGSLYLAGELRKHWVPEELVLKRRKS